MSNSLQPLPAYPCPRQQIMPGHLASDIPNLRVSKVSPEHLQLMPSELHRSVQRSKGRTIVCCLLQKI